MDSKNLDRLAQGTPLFGDGREAAIYTALLGDGAMGTEKLSQKTGLHRETIRRALVQMAKRGTVTLERPGRNQKAKAVSVAGLQSILDTQASNFESLLKPLLEVAGAKKAPKIEVYTDNHAFGLLQMRLIKLQPAHYDVRVLSTNPKEWLRSMAESRKLSLFERLRLKKEVRFLLSCLSERRGEVEHNNREYFAGQPEKLKRQYRYVETGLSSPLQTQIWFNHVVLSIFDASTSVHIVIEDARIVKAMQAYFEIVWRMSPER